MVVFFVSYDYLDKVVAHFKKNNFLNQLGEKKSVFLLLNYSITIKYRLQLNEFYFNLRCFMSLNCQANVIKCLTITQNVLK